VLLSGDNADIFRSFPNPYPQKASLASPINANMFATLQTRDRTDGNCSTYITPECLQDIYGIPTTPATSSGNSILVTGYLDQFPQNADLEVRSPVSIILFAGMLIRVVVVPPDLSF
jgi:hypothetical protein